MTSITPPLDNLGNADTSKKVEFVYEDYYDVPNLYYADRTHVTEIKEPADGEGNGVASTLLTYYHVNYNCQGQPDPLQSEGELRSVTDANGAESFFYYLLDDGTLSDWYEGGSPFGQGNYPVHTGRRLDRRGNPAATESYNGSGSATFDDNNNPTGGECDVCDELSCPYGPAAGDPPAPHIPLNEFSISDTPAVYISMPTCVNTCTSAAYDNMRNITSYTSGVRAVKDVADWNQYPADVEATFNFQSDTRSYDFQYDKLYRRTQVKLTSNEPTGGDGQPDVVRVYDFAYDANGNFTHVDDANRLLDVTVDGTVQMVAYTYYDDGRVRFADYDNGTRGEWTYDDAARVDLIKHTKTTVTLLELDYTWTVEGRVESIATSDGTESYTVDFEYDKRGRLLVEKIDDGPAQRHYHLVYTYDQLGNRWSKTDVLADPDIVTTYHYDTDADGTYDYGTENNRLMYYEVKQGVTELETTWYAYNLGGQVKRLVSNYPQSVNPGLYYVKLFQYTSNQELWLYREFTCTKAANGDPENITAVVGWQFRYDHQSMRARYLAREIDPDTLTEVSSTWHAFMNNNIHKDLSIDSMGVVTVDRTYTHGLGLVATTGSVASPPNERWFYHADMLGTSRVVTDNLGVDDHRLRFTAFGEPLPLPGLGAPPPGPPTTSTRYGYAGSWGYQNDGLANSANDLGMLHVGARYYDPVIGRFLQRDPIGIFGGLNVYAYAQNIPTNGVDPSGLIFSLGGMGMNVTLTVYNMMNKAGWTVVGARLAIAAILKYATKNQNILTAEKMRLLEACAVMIEAIARQLPVK